MAIATAHSTQLPPVGVHALEEQVRMIRAQFGERRDR